MSTRHEFATKDGAVRVSIDAQGGEQFRVRVGDAVIDVRAHRTPDGRLSFRIGDRAHVATVAPAGTSSSPATHVRLDGHTFLLKAHEGRRRAGAAAGGGAIEAPMTGTVLQIAVRPGDRVERGKVVAVLSAMKMEHKLLAAVSGVVKDVMVEVGAAVEQGLVLVRIEPDAQAS